MTRVLVCGGRGYRDEVEIMQVLDAIHADVTIERIIHGAATGADSLAALWAARRRVPADPYPADWDRIDHPKAVVRSSRRGRLYDASAGFRRNQRMIDMGHPHLVVAFPGGRGTEDMVSRAVRAGIAVRTIQ